MSMTLILSAIELGLFYTLLTLGLFISYRILDIPDLTVDGSFTLGAAVAVILTIAGHPIAAIFSAALAGILAGIVTATNYWVSYCEWSSSDIGSPHCTEAIFCRCEHGNRNGCYWDSFTYYRGSHRRYLCKTKRNQK